MVSAVKATAVGGVAVICILLILGFITIFPPLTPSESKSVTFELPQFEEIDTGWEHYAAPGVHPFAAAAAIDVDHDGRQELFVGGSKNQPDRLLRYQGGRFVDIIGGTGISRDTATTGAISLDMDNDKRTDLIITREDGVSIYFQGEHGSFLEQRIRLPLEEHALPFNVAVGDINRDGYVDLYVNTFIKPEKFRSATFNDQSHKTRNILLLNRGDNTFEDITAISGVDFYQNTFVSAFVDVDGDGWQDLVVAPNTDRIRIFKNIGENKFQEFIVSDNGFWMGLAIDDIDNDGDMDLFFTNAGKLLPEMFLRGDLRGDQELTRDWELLRNDGEMRFTSIAQSKGVSDAEFAWGATFSDLNHDAYADLIVAENYRKWRPHWWRPYDGRVFMQNAQKQFVPVTSLTGLENPYFGQGQVIADINGDLNQDIIMLNIDGPLRAFLNKGTPHHKIVIGLPDNAASIGATVSVNAGDLFQTKKVIQGAGLGTDQSADLVFGLGDRSLPVLVTVTWNDGKTQVYERLPVDKRYTISPANGSKPKTAQN